MVGPRTCDAFSMKKSLLFLDANVYVSRFHNETKPNLHFISYAKEAQQMNTEHFRKPMRKC